MRCRVQAPRPHHRSAPRATRKDARQARDQRGPEHGDANEHEHHPEDHEEEDLGRLEIGADSPQRSPANPRTVISAAIGVRKRANRPGAIVAPSRTAAIGGTRVALNAGKMLAISVTMIPRSSETMIVRALKIRPLFGSVNPTASKKLKEAGRERKAKKQPDDRRDRAHHEDAMITEKRTCRRDAPSVRSVASSRVRCAIVIERELKMTKAPTKSAITPNASRK